MGDGICDDGALGTALACEAFDWDGGDCPPDDTGGPTDTGEPEDTAVPEPIGPFDSNLLVNPGLETGDMSGWTVIEGESSCAIGEGAAARSGDYGLKTSYSLCRRTQTIDLLTAGFTEEELDAAPEIRVSEWFKERYAAGDAYVFQVRLDDVTGTEIAMFDGGGTTSGGPTYDDDEWFEVSHSFTDYGPGVRLVTIIDGGRDSGFWAGHYGVTLDDASVMLVGP